MDNIIKWILEGDISIQYLTHRDLLNSSEDLLKELQKRIETEGFGAKFLSLQKENGQWGEYYYQPKWTSTHYTLLDMKNIGIAQTCEKCQKIIEQAFDECMLKNGDINYAKTEMKGDICIDGMILNYSSYFISKDKRINKLAKFLLSNQKEDGGYTMYPESKISDPHTTICVLEGLNQYKKSDNPKFLKKIAKIENESINYLLEKDLFINDSPKYLKLSYPYRYHYSILRVLEYFTDKKLDLQETSIDKSLKIILNKRKKNKLWNLENSGNYKGKIHFEMEKTRQSSRFITLKSLKILQHFNNL